MKFKELVKESLIPKNKLLEIFINDCKILKEDSVEVYSTIFGEKELFEKVYNTFLTEGFLQGAKTGFARSFSQLNWGNNVQIPFLKRLIRGGVNFLAGHPLLTMILPLIAMTGSLFAAKKIIDKIRKRKGMKEISKEELSNLEKFTNTKESQNKINNFRNQLPYKQL